MMILRFSGSAVLGFSASLISFAFDFIVALPFGGTLESYTISSAVHLALVSPGTL
jgi:hypothetical protein